MHNPENIYPSARLVADIINWLTDNGHVDEVRRLTDDLEEVKITPLGAARDVAGNISIAELGRRIQGMGQGGSIPADLDQYYVPITGDLGVRVKKLMAAAGPNDPFAQDVAFRCACPVQPLPPVPVPTPPTPTPTPTPKPKG